MRLLVRAEVPSVRLTRDKVRHADLGEDEPLSIRVAFAKIDAVTSLATGFRLSDQVITFENGALDNGRAIELKLSLANPGVNIIITPLYRGRPAGSETVITTTP